MFVFARKWNIRLQVQFYIRLYFEIYVTMETKTLILLIPTSRLHNINSQRNMYTDTRRLEWDFTYLNEVDFLNTTYKIFYQRYIVIHLSENLQKNSSSKRKLP